MKYYDERFCKNYTSKQLEKRCYEVFEICRDIGFIYSEHSKLLRYHPSIYHSNLRGTLSPYDAFHKDDLLMEAIFNCSKYMPHFLFLDNEYLIVNKIIQRFTIKKIAAHATFFKTNTAKEIFQKYGELNKYNKVIDPFSGFSGRMVGSAELGLSYEGYDINRILVYESNKLIKGEKLQNCQVQLEDLFESKGHQSEILLTCPPYNDKEQWRETPESNLSCDEWIDEVLKRYNCKLYLFVVDKTEKYKSNIVSIKNSNNFIGSSKEFLILIK